ncbi:hypothetical protein Tco_0127318 [Tanacetum coccineum]
MAAAGPSNILARRVTDDLIDFTSETSFPKYMKYFFLQQIAKTRHFINIMREEAQTARNCIARLNILLVEIEAMGDVDDVWDTLMFLRDDIRDENTKLMGLNDVIAQAEDKISTKEGHVKIMQADNDCSITETASMNNESRVDVSSLGGLGTQCRRQSWDHLNKVLGIPAASDTYHHYYLFRAVAHTSFAHYNLDLAVDDPGEVQSLCFQMGLDRKGKGKATMKDTKQKVTGIKEVDDLEVRIKNLEDIFSNLRNRKLKQKEVRLETDDETSSNDDTSSSEDLINYLSTRDIQWQLPKNTQEEQPKPLYVPIKTEEQEPLPVHIVYPHSHFASTT